MPEVTFRRRGEIMRALFDILRDESEGLRAADALARVAERVPPNKYEAAE
ncbi:MAG: hypothetical protein ABIT38_11870 [Gemmatimonadaceae bacterium]